MNIKELAAKIEAEEKTAHCTIDYLDTQVYITFDRRPDIKIALLTPYAKGKIKKGELDIDLYADLLFSIKRIANRSIA